MAETKIQKRRDDQNIPSLEFKDVSPKDIPDLLIWFNDKEISKYMSEPGRRYDKEDLSEGFQEPDPCSKEFIILDIKTRKKIGYCAIYDITDWNRTAEISFLIGDKDFQGKGLAKEIIRFLTSYCFSELRLNSVFATATEKNIPSISVLEKNGFRRIGIRRDYHLLDGIFYDEILFDMTLTDFKLNQRTP